MNPVLPRLVAASALGALLAVPAAAVEPGRGDFASVSELTAEGFEPFPASGVARTLLGMKRGSDMYPCFIADTKPLRKKRQETLIAWLDGSSTERELPNIRVLWVLVQ